MEKTNNHLIGVVGVTVLARRINPEIGNYLEHYSTEDSHYKVHLSNNGILLVSHDTAEDFETDDPDIFDIRIEQVANSYHRE
jgi:uncharacterized protein YpmS